MKRNSSFCGTLGLLRFMLKRDKIKLTVWLVSIIGFLGAMAPYYSSMYSTPEAILEIGMSMDNPFMVALMGRPFGMPDRYSYGAMYANFMLQMTAVAVAIMSIMLISRHTLVDEENGRLEVIRSLPVGRLANATAAMILAVGANIVVAFGVGFCIGLQGIEGMNLAGSLVFGLSLGSAGIFFSAIALVCCQLSSNNRTATSMAYLVLMACYVIRGVGDNSSDYLSMVSPLGIMQQSRAYVDNNLLPLAVLVVLGVALSVLGLYFASIRDLGRGLLPQRPGKASASPLLLKPFGLVVRLCMATILGWIAITIAMNAAYGGMIGDLEAYVNTNDVLKELFANSEYSLVDQFAPILVAINGLLICVPLVGIIARIRTEEKTARMELILAKNVTRTSTIAWYTATAFALSAVLMGVGGLVMWGVGSMMTDGDLSFGMILLLSLSFLPAIWVVVGLAVCLVGLAPRQTALAHGFTAYCFLGLYFGDLLKVIENFGILSPFFYPSIHPSEPFSPLLFVVLTVIAAGLTAAGIIGFGRRDVEFH